MYANTWAERVKDNHNQKAAIKGRGPGSGVRGSGFGVRGFPRLLGSLSNDVFEQHTSTGSGLFALLSRYFEQILGQIVSIRVKTLSHTNLVASRHINPLSPNSIQDQSSPYNYPYTVKR